MRSQTPEGHGDGRCVSLQSPRPLRRGSPCDLAGKLKFSLRALMVLLNGPDSYMIDKCLAIELASIFIFDVITPRG